MKNFVLASFLLVFFANPGWCLLIDDTNAGLLNKTDVGMVDTFIEWTDKDGLPGNGNSETNEELWVNQVLSSMGITATYGVRQGSVPYYFTGQDGIFAFSLSSSEDYFIIKNSNYYALFQNQNDVDWGVFASSSLPPDMNLPSSGYTISHVTPFDSGSTPVPEPSTILLLGTGLVGLAAAARRRRK